MDESVEDDKEARMGGKKKGKSEAAGVCAACKSATSSKSHVVCVCTRVVFCSAACQQRGDGSHVCQGAPNQRVDLAARAREMLAAESTRGHFDNREGRAEMQAVESQMGVGQPGGPQRPDLSEYVRCADAGNLACAYQAGLWTRQNFRMHAHMHTRTITRMYRQTMNAYL